jgi:hypothetical protein
MVRPKNIRDKPLWGRGRDCVPPSGTLAQRTCEFDRTAFSEIRREPLPGDEAYFQMLDEVAGLLTEVVLQLPPSERPLPGPFP